MFCVFFFGAFLIPFPSVNQKGCEGLASTMRRLKVTDFMLPKVLEAASFTGMFIRVERVTTSNLYSQQSNSISWSGLVT